MKDNLLTVKGLKTQFFTEAGVVQAVDGVDFTVKRGEVLGIVGESGCGKSVTSLSILRLLGNAGKITAGEIVFDGVNLLNLSEKEMRALRGNRLAIIFQQPQSCLNPVLRVGAQLAEVLNIHQDLGRDAGKKRAVELLRMVGIPDPESRINAFPHELSGGMAQRVMIAMALACIPELLIADEPTTALDVTVQAQILALMRNLQEKLETSIILITHDLGVIAEMCDRVVVMYAGKVVEQAPIAELFDNPRHPYTQNLISATPMLGQADKELIPIPGSVPDPLHLPVGCHFAPRCRARVQHHLHICEQKEPPLNEHIPNHLVRCWLYEEGAS